ncbi:cation diffusion facilitator family transporter [Lachnospiraceae bacterium ZAX-1]
MVERTEAFHMALKNEMIPTRQKVGCKTGFIGLVSNILLAAGKLSMGVVSGSVAILADGFNNLADCISSLITIIGFRFSGRAKDKNHPYGHGRMEYISGFIISMMIIATGISFGKVAFIRILNPQPVSVYPVLFVATALCIAAKLWLALYTRAQNKEMKSTTLTASMKDSFSDALVTSITLLSLIITPFTALPIDSVVGLIVSGFILWSGITSFIENLDLLLGEGANEELSKAVKDIVMKYDAVEAITNLAVHDYGPQARIAIIQVSMAGSSYTPFAQQALASIKEELKERLGLDSTLYPMTEPQAIACENTGGSIICLNLALQKSII